MSEWQVVRLRDICDSVDYGLTASASKSEVGPKFLRITDIVGSNFDWSQVPHVAATSSQAEKYKLRHGDIVIARTGATTGRSKWIADPPDAVFASYLVRLKVNEKINSRFVGYLLKSPQFTKYVAGVLGDKSAQPNASASTLTAAKLSLPSERAIQDTIADILGTLDDKIAVNNRILTTADDTVRAIYAMFQRNITGQLRIDEIGALVKETVSVAQLGDSEKYIGLEHMPRRQMWLPRWDTSSAVTSAKARFSAGDILFGKLRPYFHKVGLAPVDGVASTDILVVRPKNKHFRGWLLAALSSDEVVAHASAVGDGTRMPRAKWADLAKFEIPWPGEQKAQEFEWLTASLARKAESSISENRSLSRLRDTLLPKLVSGEIKIRDAEKVAEDAV